MRTFLHCAAAAALLSVLGTLVPMALAQLRPQAPSPYGANAPKFGVAVIDIGYIFLNHSAFKTAMDQMKREVEQAEAKLLQQRDAIQTAEQERDTQYKPGTPNFQQLDDNITQMKADFNVQMTKMRKDFMARETKLIYDTYVTIEQTVGRYAQSQNIGLVLRFNGDQPDPNQREQVNAKVASPIVAQNNIDITADILTLLNGNNVAARQPGQSSQIPPR